MVMKLDHTNRGFVGYLVAPPLCQLCMLNQAKATFIRLMSQRSSDNFLVQTD